MHCQTTCNQWVYQTNPEPYHIQLSNVVQSPWHDNKSPGLVMWKQEYHWWFCCGLGSAGIHRQDEPVDSACTCPAPQIKKIYPAWDSSHGN